MDITFRNPGIDYMIRQIMEFQGDGSEEFWSAPLYYFYPQLDRKHAESLSPAARKEYIRGTLREAYADTEAVINEKIPAYTRHWKACRPQVTDALSQAFDVDCAGIFNDLQCNVSMNPIEPRFLKERRFDLFYLNSEKGAIGTSIHEMIHFVWFYVWNRHFRDSYDEYERPSLKWILSEMVVESIMRDERLSSINPYFPRENGGCVYPYFFDMTAGDRPVLETMEDLYRTRPVTRFMEDSYRYCREHEAEIREHIRKSETGQPPAD